MHRPNRQKPMARAEPRTGAERAAADAAWFAAHPDRQHRLRRAYPGERLVGGLVPTELVLVHCVPGGLPQRMPGRFAGAVAALGGNVDLADEATCRDLWRRHRLDRQASADTSARSNT